ncbi:Acetamidase [Madurella mycetomatis]|uniref:Acetamidase n=1 Tax=Madurella mycetomatis TaxID=100816 RepID=A0A175VVM8_9PEZI|nr:Acetamidase [Madurella mycetomatis]KXX80374.1 Acetamidase [Madurella mycetomatis]
MSTISRTVAFTLFIGCTIALLHKYGMAMVPMVLTLFGSARPWKETVAKKLRANDAKIPEQWRLDNHVIATARSRKQIAGDFIERLLDVQTRHITSFDVPDLVANMANGSLTAVQVAGAYCKRAAFAHQLSNLLLEIGFDDALARAKELDSYFEANGKLIGPLHGVPLTLKDQFHVKGLETSMAFVGWIGTFEGKKGTGKEKNVESELVRELRSLGAVPIGKAPETNNNILGYLWNPFNQRLSSGGSSGGEGVMQALRGSAFGIGTDVGGSVSMPAAFQGLFSIKPSSGRISFKDVANTGPGQQVMPTVAGIMGHSVATLKLVFQSLLSTEPWLHDPYTLPISWRPEKEYDAETEPDCKPAFGFMPNDGIVTPHPPISRAMDIVHKALEESGYQVGVKQIKILEAKLLLDWAPPSNNESAQIHGPIARGDGCADAYNAIKTSGEPFVPEIDNVFPDGKIRPALPLPEYEEVVIHMKDFRNRYNDYWISSATKTHTGRPVEAVIAPVTPYAAVLPGKFKYSQYTSSLNVLDFGTIVIPVTFANKDIDQVSPDFKPLTDKDRVNMELYNLEAYDGAPAAVQIFGRRWDEERLLSMAQLVVDALEKYKQKHGGEIS